MSNSVLDRLVRSQHWLDPLVKAIQAIVGWEYRLLGPLGRPLEDLAHGSRLLGHPLHPAATDLPIGALLTASVLDVAAHYTTAIPHAAAAAALGVAAITAVIAVFTGYTDFRDTFGHEARVAVVHGLLMTVAFVALVVSLGLRTLGGDSGHTVAVVLSLAALGLMLFGGYAGGHLVFAIGTAVNRTAFLNGGSEKFVDVGAETDFADGKLVKVDAKGYSVLVTRTGTHLCAIANICSHAGGPLDEGALKDGKVTCPWHASVFDTCTGNVIHGPATAPQPAFEVKVADGRVSVRPKVPLH